MIERTYCGKEYIINYMNKPLLTCKVWQEKTSALKTAGQIFSPIWFSGTSREFVNSKGNSRLKVNILSFIALIHKIL